MVDVMEKDPMDELEILIREATRTVEDELRLENVGWTNFSTGLGLIVPDAQRILNLQQSRIYYTRDPLARQAIRLWTDYTFGSGMTWQTEDERTKKALEGFWDARVNRSVLSARGQRKSSDKLLVDGEVFFAIFLGPNGTATIRSIDPLEITEIITDPEDIENVLYYRRKWVNRQSQQRENVYRSITNLKGLETKDALNQDVKHNDDALIYHLTYNTIGQRGNPLLLPALDWLKQYRRFLASRVAIMLALAKFAWKSKVAGGATAVDAIKSALDDQAPAAASTLVENMGVDTQPIRAETGAKGAHQDARMIKLQVCAAVGIPEQYFGDISVGNLATAKTVELPMMKMFQSYQGVWADAFRDMDELVLEHNNVPEDKWYIDRDFPPIAPADVAQNADAIVKILTVLPELSESEDVRQVALMTLGINDTAEVLDALNQESASNTDVKLVKVLKEFKGALQKTNGRNRYDA